MIALAESDGISAIERWFVRALSAVDPYRAVVSHIRGDAGHLYVDETRVPVAGRLYVVAIGKAALGMARAAAEQCGQGIAAGIILTKDGHLSGELPPKFQAFEASHPIPDERGVTATERILAMVSSTKPGDVVLVLLSGGGSALLESPRDGVTLSEIAATTDLLLKAGAPIQHLNAVRIPLSRVKGGGLRQAAPNARFVTLLLSDVLGNDPRVIASGPTVSTGLTGPGALDILDGYKVLDRVPGPVVATLKRMPANRDASHFRDDVVVTVGDNAAAVHAFAMAAADDGVGAHQVWSAREGESRSMARNWVHECISAPADVSLLLGGGEATVAVEGDGIGGRNTEFALAAALELERRGRRDWIVGSLATDGQDGPTDAAGAIAGGSLIGRARAAGIDPVDCLARNDSYRVFARTGGLVRIGPTGTNVNDIYVGLRIG